LTVLTPPIIDSQPQSQTAFVGSAVDLYVSAHGSAPLSFQWFFNGSNSIPGATELTLELPDVQFAQAGAYTVTVTNAFGALTSAPAMLVVIPTVEHRLVPGVLLRGQTGSPVKLDYVNDVDLAGNWIPLAAFALAGESQFYFDLIEPLPTQRFYRVSQAGSGGVFPTSALGMVPALTLAGAVGTSVRVDYINQFGPTTAWVALDTVTLTNTSQLFFDTSAIGQPPRLWRVVPGP